jgi:prepilin-type N-terminal cleavage/methylation domain-containing protein
MNREWGAEGRSEPSQGSHDDRVGEGGLCPPQPERGRDWEPFEGSHDNGFSLLEVMISVAILAIALVVLTRTVTGDVRATYHSRMVTAATFLARTKISSLEQNILEVGFSEMEGEDEGDFAEEGFSRFKWYAAVERMKLPTGATQQVEQSAQKKTQSTNPMEVLSGFMGSFMTTLMEPIRVGLEESVRRVTVRVKWKEPGRPEQVFEVVNFLTDPSKLDMALQGGSAATGGQTPSTTSGSTKTLGAGTSASGLSQGLIR